MGSPEGPSLRTVEYEYENLGNGDTVIRRLNMEMQSRNISIKAQWFAKISLFLALSPLSVLFLYHGPLPVLWTMVFVLVFEIPALAMGITVLVITRQKETTNKGKTISKCSVVLSVAILFYFFLLSPTLSRSSYFILNKMVCRDNISQIGKAIKIYTASHQDKLPEAQMWCDILIKEEILQQTNFLCPSIKTEIGNSCYGLNKSIIGKQFSNIAPDIVLLFESKVGWNQFGGPELLNTDSHSGKGCNILFNDLSVKFVKKKNLDKLRWE